ncbi:MAG: helix-turn-helix transcriptional regulator [Neomegalonema sp.]|nr:helix-turn-helix transcriptional regulator [Neomegalonema sp.]
MRAVGLQRYPYRVTDPNEPQCPVARTAEIIGARWTALILRDLLLKGACRFQDLQGSLAGVGSNTLSTRLKLLERLGVVERRFYADHPPRAEYLLTEKGRALGPVIAAMRDWGRAYGLDDPDNGGE